MKQIKDLPLDETRRLADEALRRYPGSQVFFKFTCEKCQTRCMFEEPNTLFAKGICNACQHEMTITKAGFLLQLPLNFGDR